MKRSEYVVRGEYAWDLQNGTGCWALETLAKKLYNGAATNIANMIVGTMDADEIVSRLGDMNKLKDEFKAQLLLAFPKTHKVIDITKLEADYRAIIFCNQPTKTKTKKFDVNADDMTIRQYRYIIQYGNKDLIRHIYQNINDKKLALFKVQDWENLILYNPKIAKRFDIKTIRNQSELRYLILRKPYILRYATIKDMQQCVIDGPTWVRIITKMTPKNRSNVPAGFIGWAKRDIFKKKLSGRKFKAFAANWTEGLKN